MEIEIKVFKDLCKSCFNFYGIDGIINATIVSKRENISNYKARKIINKLVDLELIEKTSIGRPAIEEEYEYIELVCEAQPPINGYKLTDKGRMSKAYKRAEVEYNESLRSMANGE